MNLVVAYLAPYIALCISAIDYCSYPVGGCFTASGMWSTCACVSSSSCLTCLMDCCSPDSACPRPHTSRGVVGVEMFGGAGEIVMEVGSRGAGVDRTDGSGRAIAIL